MRARYPQPSASNPIQIPLADLMPIVHARDAAEAKVAAIGTVNPRSGGPLNLLIQSVKRLVSRALDWHVREQVEFNRQVMACVESTLEALNEMNRSLLVVGGRILEPGNELGLLRAELQEMKDMRSHWAQWRLEWEQKLFQTETQLLRSVAELQGAFQHRAMLMESSFRDAVKSQSSDFREATKSQHAEFAASLERNTIEVQKRFWEQAEKMRVEMEKLIHAELRVIRQRALAAPATLHERVAPSPEPASAFDYARFAERFRGSEEYVKENQKIYLPYFEGRGQVLDIGCGRGEFLELMRDSGIQARGIDLSVESVNYCRQKGLQAEVADLFPYLDNLPDGSLDGIFSSQVVEHLPPERLPEMIRLAAAKLDRNGLLALETPNPECLAIFATHFYLDPTHMRPIPAPLLSFYMEECGLSQIEVRRLLPASESMPALMSLPEDFRNAFFGGLDYAIFAHRLW